MDNIYFRGAEEATTLEELLRLGFSSSGQLYFIETFSDPGFTIQQCKAGSRRSFEDLLAIANTYFPGTSEEDLMLVLTKLEFLKFYYCGDVQKVVFHGIGNIKIPHFELITNDSEDYKQNTYLPQRLKEIYENLKLS